MFKQSLIFIWELFKIAFLAFVIVVPIRYFLFQPFIVRGASMEPTFHSGDYLIVDEITYRFRDPKRGEVVVFNFPFNPSQRYIKRVIGLPGETIEIKDGKVFVGKNSKSLKLLDESKYVKGFTAGNLKIILGKDEYFVLGDNRAFSSDSRNWGVLPRKYIIGRVFLRVFPLSQIKEIKSPQYSL